MYLGLIISLNICLHTFPYHTNVYFCINIHTLVNYCVFKKNTYESLPLSIPRPLKLTLTLPILLTTYVHNRTVDFEVQIIVQSSELCSIGNFTTQCRVQ